MNRWGGDKLDANGESTWDGGTGQTTYRTRNMRPNEDGKNMRTVWSINTEPSTEAHFATYPQRLVERMLKAGCPENGIVLDPFFGSGTTGVYARKVNRNFVGIELNPEYVKIAENRLLKEIGMFL
jgi:DNA modification methylase